MDSHNLERINLTLKLLTQRTVMLLALTHLSRSADLARLSLAAFTVADVENLKGGASWSIK